MPRDYKIFLEDILDAIQKINVYTADLSFEKFKNDPKTLDAVIRNLEVIGEAIKNIPEEIRTQYPDIEWKKIAGLRDILIHEYFGANIKIIWDVKQNKLPRFEKHIKRILLEKK